MHEISIAESLLALVRRHTPAGMRVTQVSVEAGPHQGIDPDALAMAWQAVTLEANIWPDSTVKFTALPWNVSCPQCQRQWTGTDPFEPCTCGNQKTTPSGSAELRLISLEVEPLAPPSEPL